ncbi:hypothetical protein NAF17_04105 [Mucilaginibacter sp. RB4R14]|uniref:hypothetical protein n=1 Tax=Mucilaginibacter aurantiaciroseus TaxID=2949308 RepID=UPI002091465A|nr:hypothetical protein [Mucilaginibacter aurantiaciroseus]MCO5934713.1 hypothetical protein [Mucilaginibacter aurantiaciroseus]
MTFKKTLLLLSATAVIFSACENQHAKDESKAEAPKLTAQQVIDTDSLSYERAKQYVKNYEKHAGTVDSNYSESNFAKTKKKPNTRCIWFSADRILALAQKIKDEGGDGIRFYLASYDTVYASKFNGRKPPRDYWGYNTLVMVSTKDSVNKVDEHFHRDYYTNGKVTPSKPATGFILGGVPENRGEICPPPKTCNTVGATLIP